MTPPSKINGHDLDYPRPEDRARAEEAGIAAANIAYIEAIQEACGGNVISMVSASMSATITMLSATFQGNQQRTVDVFRTHSEKFADMIEAAIIPDDRVLN